MGALAAARWRKSDVKCSSGIGWQQESCRYRSHAGERERIGRLLDADGDAGAAELCARSMTVLQSGALILSVRSRSEGPIELEFRNGSS